jgi:hypothetical protein
LAVAVDDDAARCDGTADNSTLDDEIGGDDDNIAALAIAVDDGDGIGGCAICAFENCRRTGAGDDVDIDDAATIDATTVSGGADRGGGETPLGLTIGGGCCCCCCVRFTGVATVVGAFTFDVAVVVIAGIVTRGDDGFVVACDVVVGVGIGVAVLVVVVGM